MDWDAIGNPGASQTLRWPLSCVPSLADPGSACRDGGAMTAVLKERFVVVYVRRDGGLEAGDIERIESAMARHNPQWVQLLAPEGLLFLLSPAVGIVPELKSDLSALATEFAANKPISFGISEGELIVQRAADGKLSAQPIGMPINDAMRAAVLGAA